MSVILTGDARVFLIAVVASGQHPHETFDLKIVSVAFGDCKAMGGLRAVMEKVVDDKKAKYVVGPYGSEKGAIEAAGLIGDLLKFGLFYPPRKGVIVPG